MWPNPYFTADLVALTEEILNGKLIFLYSARCFGTSNAEITGFVDINFILKSVAKFRIKNSGDNG